MIKAFNNSDICAISYGARQNAINNTITAIQHKGLDGVNIDFEGANGACQAPYPSDPNAVQRAVTQFSTALSDAVHAAVPGSLVTIDTYSGSASWDGGEFNIGQLAASSLDAMFVMAYDMNSSDTPGQAGANAPLDGPWQYTDTSSVAQYLSKASAAKVILGVPYYGRKWCTLDNQANSAARSCPDGASSPMATTYSQVLSDLSCGAQQLQQWWDANAQSPWASWFSPAASDPCGGNHNSWRELYYDNAASLGLKYDLVNRNNLRGTGMWALGMDGDSQDLWNELYYKFALWHRWESLGGPITFAPAVSSWASGRVDVFVRGTDFALWHRWYDNGLWSVWERLGGQITSSPAAASWSAGRLDVFALGTDTAIWHRWFQAGSWSGWQSLGGSLTSGPAAASWGGGRWAWCTRPATRSSSASSR